MTFKVDPYLSSAEDTLADPLSAITRKERRNLLGAATIGWLIVDAGLVPSRITALGIDFDRADQDKLIMALALCVAYFFWAFAIYAWADFLAWRVRIIRTIEAYGDEAVKAVEDGRRSIDEHPAGREIRRGIAEVQEKMGLFNFPRFRQEMPKAIMTTSVVRVVFEFLLPLLFGYFAFCRILH